MAQFELLIYSVDTDTLVEKGGTAEYIDQIPNELFMQLAEDEGTVVSLYGLLEQDYIDTENTYYRAFFVDVNNPNAEPIPADHYHTVITASRITSDVTKTDVLKGTEEVTEKVLYDTSRNFHKEQYKQAKEKIAKENSEQMYNDTIMEQFARVENKYQNIVESILEENNGWNVPVKIDGEDYGIFQCALSSFVIKELLAPNTILMRLFNNKTKKSEKITPKKFEELYDKGVFDRFREE